jgi:hypothetical protein
MAKVEPVTESGCWIWMGALEGKNKKYRRGKFNVGKQVIAKAHRAAFELFKGPIPSGAHVLHDCDVSYCVNPAHLHLGTHLENMHELRARNPRCVFAPGEKHSQAKLTESDALAIRAASGTQKEIAKTFGVTQATISNIRTRKNWTHVGP